jgi:hypothetical protein
MGFRIAGAGCGRDWVTRFDPRAGSGGTQAWPYELNCDLGSVDPRGIKRLSMRWRKSLRREGWNRWFAWHPTEAGSSRRRIGRRIG